MAQADLEHARDNGIATFHAARDREAYFVFSGWSCLGLNLSSRGRGSDDLYEFKFQRERGPRGASAQIAGFAQPSLLQQRNEASVSNVSLDREASVERERKKRVDPARPSNKVDSRELRRRRKALRDLNIAP